MQHTQGKYIASQNDCSKINGFDTHHHHHAIKEDRHGEDHTDE